MTSSLEEARDGLTVTVRYSSMFHFGNIIMDKHGWDGPFGGQLLSSDTTGRDGTDPTGEACFFFLSHSHSNSIPTHRVSLIPVLRREKKTALVNIVEVYCSHRYCANIEANIKDDWARDTRLVQHSRAIDRVYSDLPGTYISTTALAQPITVTNAISGPYWGIGQMG